MSGTQWQASTVPGPALYAARASWGEPNWRIRPDIRWASASIAATGSKGFLKPYEAAVEGMNWAMPCAPAGEPALGSKPDSAISWAPRSAAETLQCAAAWRIVARNWLGTNEGSDSPESEPSDWRPIELPSSEQGAGPASKPKCHASHE